MLCLFIQALVNITNIMSSLKEKSLKGLFWDFIGRIGLQGVGFFVSIFLARILAPEDFGLLAIITVLIHLAGVFLDFGFSTALIQRAKVTDSHYASVFYMNVTLGLILASLIFCLAPAVASFYDNAQLLNLTRFMSLSFIVSSLGNVLRARLRREMKFKAISVANIVAAVISGTGALYLAWAGYGVWSLAVQSITNQFLANIILFVLSPTRINLRFSFQSLKDLWAFSSRMFFSGLTDTLFINADSLVIGKVLNISTLGFYYRAKSLENFSMRYTASTIASVLLPSLSSLQDNPEKLKQAVVKVFHILSIISYLGCGLLLVSSRELIILIFSAKWEPSIIMFQILIAGAFATQLFSLFYNTLLSTGNVDTYFKINLLSKTIGCCNFATLLFWDLKTYLVLFTGIRLITFFLGMYHVSKILHVGNEFYKQTAKYLIIYFISLILSFWFKTIFTVQDLYLSLLVSALFFGVIFLILTSFMQGEGFKIMQTELIIPLRKKASRNC